MKDLPGVGGGPINMPEIEVQGRRPTTGTPAPNHPGVTIEESTMVVINDSGRNADVTINNQTYNVALSQDGNSVSVTTGTPPQQVTGAALDAVRGQLRSALEGAEDSGLDAMSREAASTRRAPTANNV